MDRVFFTDGSANPNPGPGSYAWIELYIDEKGQTYARDWYVGIKENTTNNEQELSAIRDVLHVIEDDILCGGKDNYYIFSDSAYAINCITEWASSWKRNGWVRSGNKPIENLKIIKDCHRIYMDYIWQINFVKVKGHAGIDGNMICDELCQRKESWQKIFDKYKILYYDNIELIEKELKI